MVLGINNFFRNVNTNCIVANKLSTPSFKGLNQLEEDTFELSSDKNVTIKDISGNDIPAKITEKPFAPGIKMFELTSGERLFGYSTVVNDTEQDYLYLSKLQTEPHNFRTYKGAGTELLKKAVLESKKRGFDGKIKTYAANGIHTPYAFYYKNNFTLPQGDKRNALIQYAIENQIPVNKIIPEYECQAVMYLNETGANAILDGKRLYKDRAYQKTVAETIVGNHKYTADFMQSPFENEYFLVVTDDRKFKIHNCVITLQEKENENGEKYFNIKKVDDYIDDEQLTNFEIETINKIAKEKGYGETTVAQNLNSATKRWIKDCDTDLQQE